MATVVIPVLHELPRRYSNLVAIGTHLCFETDPIGLVPENIKCRCVVLFVGIETELFSLVFVGQLTTAVVTNKRKIVVTEECSVVHEICVCALSLKTSLKEVHFEQELDAITWIHRWRYFIQLIAKN